MHKFSQRLQRSSTHAPLFLRLRSSKIFIITTVSTAVFTDIFAYALIVPVVPFALTSRVGTSPESVQTWISILLAVYGAALLVTAPFCGWFADRYSSRRIPMLLGLVALAGSTVMLCIGSSIGILIAGRILQGMSAAVVWVVGLALLVDTVGSADVGQAMGYVGISMSLAILVAPLLGGIVFAQAGYYAVFAMAFGLVALDVILRLVMIERKVAAKWLEDDSPTIAAAVKVDEVDEKQVQAQVINASDGDAIETKLPETPTSDQPNDEKKSAQPVPTRSWAAKLPPVLRLLASRRLLSALFACLVQSTLATSFDATLPLFVKRTFDWNSIGAGLIFLPLVVASFVGPVIGGISDKYGPRWLATAGFVLGGPFLILLRLVTYNSIGQKVLLCALLTLVGVSLALVLTPILAEMTYAVNEKEKKAQPGEYGANGAYAQAYSLLNISWAAGCFIGPLLSGLVNESQGWATANLILGCLSLFAAIPTAIWTGGSIFKVRRRAKQDALAAQSHDNDTAI